MSKTRIVTEITFVLSKDQKNIAESIALQHWLPHIGINATSNHSSSQFGMAVVTAICTGILLPSTGRMS
jgi:hypothetical protein